MPQHRSFTTGTWLLLPTLVVEALACTQKPEPEVPVYRAEAPAPIDDENELAAYVAQCEAVLGPVPEISCDPSNPAPGTRVTRIPVFSEGRLLGFGGPWDEAELARRAQEQDYTCDFPSVGGDFACSIGSTLVQFWDENNPNVQWVGLCRGVRQDTPTYDRFVGNGLIGANTITGEMCFFFGGNPDTEEDYLLPRLTSAAQSNEELKPWLPPRQMPGSCLSCHPNNDPWILTPWLQPGYMAQVLLDEEYPLVLPEGVDLEDVMAARFIRPTEFQYKTLLPAPLAPGRTAWTEEEIVDVEGRLLRRQYRAVGSSYVAAEAAGTVMPRTGVPDPTWEIPFRERLLLHPTEESCARECHATANAHFEEMAYDSLGEKYAMAYLSDFMLQQHRLATWMPLGHSAGSWLEVFEAVEATVPAITECPIPARLTSPVEVSLSCVTEGKFEVEFRWSYFNEYGGVPGRDDVRFDAALSFGDEGSELGVAENGIEGVVMESGTNSVMILRDVAPETGTAAYSLMVPFSEDKPLARVELQPKRYCFEEPERRPFAYAKPTTVLVPTLCD